MYNTDEMIQAQILGLSAIVTNAVRSVWDQALILGQPSLFEAAKAPLHFVQDTGQLGQMITQHIGLNVYTFQAQHPIMQDQFPPLLYQGLSPAAAPRVFQAVYSAQNEAVTRLQAYYDQSKER